MWQLESPTYHRTDMWTKTAVIPSCLFDSKIYFQALPFLRNISFTTLRYTKKKSPVKLKLTLDMLDM
jgi:hypothetical protein